MRVIINSLPFVGIVAFSLCSVWALFQLFQAEALHPTPLYWLPAIFIELITAWVVAQAVQQMHNLTRSNISKQDRRFHGIILALFLIVGIPLMATSVWANKIEFNDELLLGLLFPIASIGCAIGAILPTVVEKKEKETETERQEAETGRKRKKEERELLKTVGNAAKTWKYFQRNPDASREKAAHALKVSRTTINNHLKTLEQVGLMRDNGTQDKDSTAWAREAREQKGIE